MPRGSPGLFRELSGLPDVWSDRGWRCGVEVGGLDAEPPGLGPGAEEDGKKGDPSFIGVCGADGALDSGSLSFCCPNYNILLAAHNDRHWKIADIFDLI